MCRVIRKPHSVSCCVMHVPLVSFVKLADVRVSGANGSEQSICPVCRCSVVLSAMILLALAMVGS